MNATRATGTPASLRQDLTARWRDTGRDGDPTLEDVFRHFAGSDLGGDQEGGSFRDVRRTRHTASRVG